MEVFDTKQLIHFSLYFSHSFLRPRPYTPFILLPRQPQRYLTQSVIVTYTAATSAFFYDDAFYH